VANRAQPWSMNLRFHEHTLRHLVARKAVPEREQIMGRTTLSLADELRLLLQTTQRASNFINLGTGTVVPCVARNFSRSHCVKP
jgi:hypothetical protein